MATTKITNPDLFDLGNLNTALRLPSGTTADRPTSPSTGEWRYNTDDNVIEFYDGAAWLTLQSEDIPPIPSENFNTVLYDGTSATHAITGVGFQPDLVWIKDRNNSESHIWNDSSRGAGNDLSSNNLNVQANRPTGFVSFDNDGFTLGTDAGGVVNDSSRGPYVAWCFKANGGTTSTNTEGTITSTVQANTQAGFSIVQWTGTGSSGTIGHGLNSAPEMLILKDTTVAYNWYVFTTATGSNIRFEGLNNANLSTSAPSQMTSTATLIENVPALSSLNTSGSNMIIYAFHSVAGYSKIGSYTGNGSDNGPIINTGFEPAWLMIKVSTGSADGWFMVDNKRSTSNPRGLRVFANSNVGDASESGAQVDFLTNGFQLRGTGSGQGQTNGSGNQYIYMAFASDPSTAPVLASSFTTNTYTGTGSARSISGLGLAPNLTWIKNRSSAASHSWTDSVRGNNLVIQSNETAAEATGQITLDTDGFTIGNNNLLRNANGDDYVAWNWKANPIPTINTDGTIQSVVSANQAAGFSIVNYIGTGADATVGHGLSAAPDLLIVKGLDTTNDWAVLSADGSDGDFLQLNSSSAESGAGSIFGSTFTRPTSTVFSIGNTGETGTNNSAYIAYCFHSVTGFSKISTYTGTGTGVSQGVTGLGFSPNWVLIKEIDGADSWQVYDTARGAGKVLYPNGNNAEYAGSELSSFDSDGFTVTGNPNESGKSYLYMAFKENPAQPAIPSGYMAYLVVAGGGSGHRSDSNNGAGGGGAGGLRSSYVRTGGGGTVESNITLTAKTYTITIGAGGADNSTSGGPAISGSNSVLDTITSVGGGGGGGVGLPAEASTSGGSGGGGGGYNSGAGAAGTTNQGFAGGNGSPSTSGTFSERNGGGGGGAGSVGVTGSTSSAGQGGFGVIVPITGTNVGYAGGGSGGNKAGSGISSTSGGGTGAGTNGIGTSGAVNTGGGGGGGGVASYAGKGGGSGVVILRMNTSDYSGTTTGSPTVTTIGSETILTYTGSGTYVHS